MADESPKRSRRRWSQAEKQALLRQARALLAEGESWDSAASEVGVWPSSLKRWSEQFPEPSFKSVVVSDVVPAPVVPSVVITTPDGFRIEGLDTDGAFLLLESLRCSV